MEWLSIALVGAALAGLGILWWRGRGRRAAGRSAGPGEEARRIRQDTALSELRGMREALGPATHNRIERRRNPQPGATPKVERRRKGTRRGSE